MPTSPDTSPTADPDDAHRSSEELQRMAGIVRRAMDHDRVVEPGGSWSADTWALICELTDEVAATLAAGHPRRLAEFAVTGWIITGVPLEQCVTKELELRLFELPRPGRGRQGFNSAPAG